MDAEIKLKTQIHEINFCTVNCWLLSCCAGSI
jgi:hypothetical protein